jgi:hypothetical protein
MQKYLTIFGAIIGWFAVITQYYLMIENNLVSLPEATVRFFSFFTILTNTMVAVYFSALWMNFYTGRPGRLNKPGTLTALTVYILAVGLVYQIILRSTWEPTGMQMVVDELLHTIIPLYVLLYWFLYEEKYALTWSELPKWLLFPLGYFVFILLRGTYSGFYPYPFVHVQQLGYPKVMVNSLFILLLFLVLSGILLTLGKKIAYSKK